MLDDAAAAAAGSPRQRHGLLHLVARTLPAATVSPLIADDSSHHVAAAAGSSSSHSSPGLSPRSSHGTPRCRHNYPRPPRSASAPPPLRLHMDLDPVSLAPPQESHFHHDHVNLEPAMTEVVLPPAMENGSHPPVQSPSPAPDPSPIPALSELSRLLRLQKYHRRRSHQVEDHLRSLQIAAAKTNRLVNLSRSIQSTLAECIRSEDKNSFVNLLHAFHDACDSVWRTSSTPEWETEPALNGASQQSHSFLGELSPSSRTAVLDLFSKIRYDGSFVSNCLLSLTSKELIALLPEQNNSSAGESVFGNAARISRTSKPLGFVVDAQLDLLTSFGYSSPLECLVSASGGLHPSSSDEHDRATDVWATVCARLIAGQKNGSEKFVPAVLDIWASSMPWPGKKRLEVWILQTLQQGAFLLDQPTKPTFRARMEGRSDISPEEEQRTEAFYASAAVSLLELLGDQTGASALPAGALKMCHAVWTKLSSSPGHQIRLPQFLLVRWLFSSFVVNSVTLPEANGLLTDHHVSETARHRILREVATRARDMAYEVAYSYSWKQGKAAAAETVKLVNNITTRFQGSQIRETPIGSVKSKKPAHGQTTDVFLVISAKDVAISLNALYPQRRPPSVSSDSDNLRPGLQSSASSISGLSLFSQARPVEQSSEGTSPPQGIQSPGSVETAIADPALADEESPLDSTHMREVCLEVEDLLTGRTGSKDSWDVLTTQPQERALLTMRSKMSQVCSPSTSCRDGSVTPLGEARLSGYSKEHTVLRRALEKLLRSAEATCFTEPLSTSDTLSQAYRDLETLFEQKTHISNERTDFVKAHTWFQQAQGFQAYVSQSADMGSLLDLLIEIELYARTSFNRSLKVEDACEAWIRSLDTVQELLGESLRPILDEHERLRDKMWYVADVRTSAAYDDARSIASALRVMGKPKRLSRTRLAPPLRHWSTSKLSSINMHLKTEAQILDILSARLEHGGPNKLSDDQSRGTQLWMDRSNIDNLCKGEERLHKLCMEIRKCVDQVVATSAESSTLLSNPLFARDAAVRHQRGVQRKPSLLVGLSGTVGQHGFLPLSTQRRSNDGLSSASHTLSNASSRDYLESRSPTLASKSSMPFWSPAMTEIDSPSSATSIGESHTPSALDHALQHSQNPPTSVDQSSLERLRHRITSLVLSDLTSVLFQEGSETDCAFWYGLGQDLTERHFRGLHTLPAQTPATNDSSPAKPLVPRFGFDVAFSTILQKFSAMSNPSTKLTCLYDLDRLLVPYMAEQATIESPSLSLATKSSELGQLVQARKTHGFAETSVAGFRHIFSESTLRPRTIFRDLQYIAALLPSSVLHNTPEGKAFCNAAVAITLLKQEARKIMVETADSIIAYHTNNRGHGRSPSTAQQQRDSATFAAPSRTPSAEDVSRYSMTDAAYLYQIAAKEGDPVAQRELATLYLSHPELMDRIIAPFARTKDVFKEELESKWRKQQHPSGCDPTTMCVVIHWMNLSSRGGDLLAKQYLTQEMESA